MKISKLLPVTLALMLGMSGAFAAERTIPANAADYQLQLNEYLNIVAEGPATPATVEYTGDYDGITVATTSGTYAVTSNRDTKDIYFYATCLAGEAEVPALYGTALQPKVIFTNTQIGTVNNSPVSSTQVTGMRNGTIKTPEGSPNAIALNLTISHEMLANSFPNSKTISAPALENVNNVKYTIPNCKATFTCSVGGSAQDNSFSTLDTNGLYRATIYLSDTPQTL